MKELLQMIATALLIVVALNCLAVLILAGLHG